MTMLLGQFLVALCIQDSVSLQLNPALFAIYFLFRLAAPSSWFKYRQTKTFEQLWSVTVHIDIVGLHQDQTGQGFVVETLEADVLWPKSD